MTDDAKKACAELTRMTEEMGGYGVETLREIARERGYIWGLEMSTHDAAHKLSGLPDFDGDLLMKKECMKRVADLSSDPGLLMELAAICAKAANDAYVE